MKLMLRLKRQQTDQPLHFATQFERLTINLDSATTEQVNA
jgi:hypothetical protein